MTKARIERSNTRNVNGFKVYDAKFIDENSEYIERPLAVLKREGNHQVSTPTETFTVERLSATEYRLTSPGSDGECDVVQTFDRLWKAKAEIARLVLAKGNTYPTSEEDLGPSRDLTDEESVSGPQFTEVS